MTRLFFLLFDLLVGLGVAHPDLDPDPVRNVTAGDESTPANDPNG